MYYFEPPTYRQGPTGPTRLDRFYTVTKGMSILKVNGVYVEYLFPINQDTIDAEVAYIGGHVYTVTDDEADRLRNAGYGAGLTEII